MGDSEVEQLVAQSKKLRDVSRKRNYLQNMLSELTVCKNVAALSTRLKKFSTNILSVACQVVPSSNLPLQFANQTLIIAIKNASDNLIFNSDHWQFCVGIDSAQSTWNLETSLEPGQIDKFCCPLKTNAFNFPHHKVSVALKFTIQFESKTYTRHFPIQECIVDVLHFLDPGRSLGESGTVNFNCAEGRSFVDLLSDNESDISFPPITKFIFNIDASLKEIFVKEILLRDSLHRGFSESLPELNSTPEISVHYMGNKIEIKKSDNSELISVSCLNPSVLCAVKAAILRRFICVEGIMVDGLSDSNLEKVHSIKLKLSSFESECNPESVDVTNLFQFYLDLREVSESIRFSMAHVVE